MTNYDQYSDPEARKEYERNYRADPVNRERQREYMRQWRLANPDKIKGYNAKWWRENPQRHAELNARWRESNWDKVLQGSRRYREANPEKTRAAVKRWEKANPESAKKRTKKWRTNNPETAQAKDKRHGAKRRSAPGDFSVADWKALITRSPICFWCKKPFNKNRKRTLDHVIPLSKGGHHIPENAVCACSSCNSTKHDHLFDPATGQGLLL